MPHILTVFAWVKTFVGFLKTVFSAIFGVLAGLLALEVAPMAGLLMLVAFEGSSEVYATHTKGKLWSCIKRVLVARIWVIIALAMGVVYYNISHLEFIRWMLIVVCGGALWVSGWFRLGKKVPIARELGDLIVSRMKGSGIDLTVVDEEGRRSQVVGMVEEASVLAAAQTPPVVVPVVPQEPTDLPEDEAANQ